MSTCYIWRIMVVNVHVQLWWSKQELSWFSPVICYTVAPFANILPQLCWTNTHDCLRTVGCTLLSLDQCIPFLDWLIEWRIHFPFQNRRILICSSSQLRWYYVIGWWTVWSEVLVLWQRGWDPWRVPFFRRTRSWLGQQKWALMWYDYLVCITYHNHNNVGAGKCVMNQNRIKSFIVQINDYYS